MSSTSSSSSRIHSSSSNRNSYRHETVLTFTQVRGIHLVRLLVGRDDAALPGLSGRTVQGVP